MARLMRYGVGTRELSDRSFLLIPGSWFEDSNMLYAKSLRVIGQWLETASVTTFELEKCGNYYVVWTDYLTEAGQWILQNALDNHDFSTQITGPSTANRAFCFCATDITRLDARSQKKRRNHSSSVTQASKLLSQLLRTLGDHLDRTEVRTFHISWTPDSISIDYQTPDGQRDSRIFTREKLQGLCLHTRFRRSSPSRVSADYLMKT
jgi:hypothetical protein